MCELLGLSANVPTDICFSFTGLVQRGGRTGPHKDGWGISLYEGRGSRSFHDPRPSVASEIAALLQRHAIKSKIIISHIRQANRGRICLENTHPFNRELWGCSWVFAHNGQLKGIKRWPLDLYRTVGTTDSEHAFCWLLDQIRRRFPSRPRRPQVLWRFIHGLAREIGNRGVFSFMMSDARYLYAYCSNNMCWLTRRHPFGVARLIDTGMEIDFSQQTTPEDVVTVIASHPLTDNEIWHEMDKGDFLIFRDGERLV
ncbi:MAG: class II glutamine amidotransferase [Pseudomonadota bacterium]|nr:class II glutamine amidotransferase [Pseudomonadota bacterium]